MDLHPVAVQQLRSLAAGPVPWALPTPVIWGFLRIVTQQVFDPPTPMAQAEQVIQALLDSPSARLISAGPRHWTLLRQTHHRRPGQREADHGCCHRRHLPGAWGGYDPVQRSRLCPLRQHPLATAGNRSLEDPMTALNDLIAIPAEVHKSDFVIDPGFVCGQRGSGLIQ
jgi:hypothetical protein